MDLINRALAIDSEELSNAFVDLSLCGGKSWMTCINFCETFSR